jgi:hypothetical protein
MILAMPSHSNFATPIQDNLKYHNFDIEFINSSPEHLKRLKLPFTISICHFFRKIFHVNASTYKTEAKQFLKNQIIVKEINDKLSNQNFDYALVIRPDLFSLTQLELIKTYTYQKFIGYQWNGLGRFPDTLLSIKLFDRFFIFDHTDLSNPDYASYPLLGCTNFYFDMYQPQPIAHHGIIAYFVGLHFDERSMSINFCAQELVKHGIILDFNIKFRHGEQNAHLQYPSKEIKFIKKNIDFDENIKRINQADILVDVVNPIHNGLSFRTFEALYYEKKLITNNKMVQNYDFYHPNNILIWDGQDLTGLTAFLAKPFTPIDKKIVEKYGFKNWIKNILDLPPYQLIRLPDSFD